MNDPKMKKVTKRTGTGSKKDRKGRKGKQRGEIPTVVWMVRKDGVAWQKESGNVG